MGICQGSLRPVPETQHMVSWFLADVAALENYYGSGFDGNKLPKRQDVETIAKDTVLSSLRAATRNTKKGRYSKGSHSFAVLALIDPEKVTALSPWAKRFLSILSKKMRALASRAP